MIKFDYSKMSAGMVLHVRSYTLFGKLIRKALNVQHPVPRCWGNHDGMIIEANGSFYSGDSAPIFARMTPISQYERDINIGKCECRIYALKCPYNTSLFGRQAAESWVNDICSTPYDFTAFGRLLWKAVIGDFSNSKNKYLKAFGDRACGTQWANWCTEGVAKSFDSVTGGSIYGSPNPTPYTTEKRVGKVFEDVTDSVIIKIC